MVLADGGVVCIDEFDKVGRFDPSVTLKLRILVKIEAKMITLIYNYPELELFYECDIISASC